MPEDKVTPTAPAPEAKKVAKKSKPTVEELLGKVQTKFPERDGTIRKIPFLWEDFDGHHFRVNFFDKVLNKIIESHFIRIHPDGKFEVVDG